MKRFLLFVGDRFYPVGGAWDLRSAHDTLDEAREEASNFDGRFEWWNILDTQNGQVTDENTVY